MALSEKIMNHPRFLDVSRAVNEAISSLAWQFDVSESDLESQRAALDRAADDMTRAILNAWDANHA